MKDNSTQQFRFSSYILALKGELAQSVSTSHKPTSGNNSSTSQMEQTILSLRRLVERLKVENKNLKEGKGVNATKGIVPKVSVSNHRGNSVYESHEMEIKFCF